MTGSRQSSDSVESNNSGRVNRRQFIHAGTAATIAGLAGCSGGSGGSGTESSSGSSGSGTDSGGETVGSTGDESVTLRVSVWSGTYADYFRQTVKKRYEEETGNTLKVIPGWNEILSKIKAAPADNPPYDVSITDGYFYHQGMADNLFTEVNYDNVPNIDNVYPYLKEFWTTKYGVPTDGSPMALIYNSDNIDWEPSNWQDLEEAEKVGMEGGFYVYPLHVGAIAADQKSGAQEIYNESSHSAVFDQLEAFDVKAWYGSGAEVWELFRQGTVNIAQWYYGTALQEAQEQDNVNAVLPPTTTAYFDHYCPVRGTDKKAEAEELLNFMLRPEVQTEWTNSANLLMSTKGVEYSDLTSEDYPQSNEEYKNTFAFPDWGYLSDYSSKFSDNFQKLKTS